MPRGCWVMAGVPVRRPSTTHANRFRLALEMQGSDWTKLEDVACREICALSHQDGIGAGNLLQASGNVHSITRDEKILPAELRSWSRDLARVDANAHLQTRRFRVLCLPSLVEPGEGGLHV